MGSIQLDPFSPEHVPRPAQHKQRSPSVAASPPAPIGIEISDDEEEDVFAQLGRMGDEAQRKEQEEREAREEKEWKKEKKRKRREEKEKGDEKDESRKARKKKKQ